MLQVVVTLAAGLSEGASVDPALHPLMLIGIVVAVIVGGLALLLIRLVTRASARAARISGELAYEAGLRRALFDACPIGLFVLGPDGTVQDANDVFLAVGGWTRTNLAAGGVQWVLPEPPTAISPDPQGAPAHRDYETEHVRPDGTRVFMRVTVHPTEQGVAVGTVTDLGDRRAIEAALRASEKQFQRVVSAAHVGAWDWNIGDDRLDIAPAELVHQMFDRQAGSITCIADFIEIVQPAYRERILRAIDGIIRVADMNEYEAEFPIRAADGNLRWFRTPGHVTARDASGRALHLSGVVQDVTERKRIADALRQLTDNLERRVRQEVAGREAAQLRAARAERLQALGQLASGIAHDFNNVLQAVAGASSLIEQRPDDADAFARFARILTDATARGASITQRLLAFTRHDNLHAEPVDPVSLLSTMREILAHTLGGSIEVRIEAPQAVPRIMADRGQLQTVLVNLATNARDAMPNGGVLTLAAGPRAVNGIPAQIEAGAVKSDLANGEYVCLSVIDTGVGMDAPTLARVTEPFFTTKPLGEGTGLGLSMAKSFAEQSGGGLSITSEPGRGTTVTLWLPIPAEMPAAVISPVPEPRDLRQGRSPNTIRVLLVDDDGLVCEAMHDVLADMAFQVVALESGEAAVDLVDAGESFDILVTDLSMPRMDGVSLIHALHERQPNLPAILLTGFSEANVAAAVHTATGGRVAVLRKPVRAADLAARIVAMLGQARQSDSVEPG
jgi:signal transduction histidine kinase/ActR/RegA family two-component response regulator